jgi:hypothetical protein
VGAATELDLDTIAALGYLLHRLACRLRDADVAEIA